MFSLSKLVGKINPVNSSPSVGIAATRATVSSIVGVRDHAKKKHDREKRRKSKSKEEGLGA